MSEAPRSGSRQAPSARKEATQGVLRAGRIKHFWSMYLTTAATVQKCLQLNPKFRLSRPALVIRDRSSAACPRLCAAGSGKGCRADRSSRGTERRTRSRSARPAGIGAAGLADKMTVNSGGISGYSAMIFTPPSDMSVIMQSRGKPPVANCIFAKLPARTTFAAASICQHVDPWPCSCDSPDGAPALPKNCWNWPIGTARNVAVVLGLRLPNPGRALRNDRRPATFGRSRSRSAPGTRYAVINDPASSTPCRDA